MSSGVTHFSSEDIEHLSNSFQKMGREYKSSQGSNHNDFAYNLAHAWEDDTDDLKEEDVWGVHDTDSGWSRTYTESDAIQHVHNSLGENGSATKRGKSRKSWLSLELQPAGASGHKREYIGVGFAALEATQSSVYGGGRESNGGWAPGFSTRKVQIPHIGGRASGSGYANGWHDEVASKRGGVPQSAPVSMPVWPTKCGYGDSNEDVDADDSSFEDGVAENEDDDNSDEDYQGERRRRLAPHEIVDREYARSTTFSVIEGAGRTLKGSDLRRVRNAVWSCTGFED